MEWLLLLVLAAALLLLARSVRRGTELFVVRAGRGQVRFVRGRMPPALFTDLCELFRDAAQPLRLTVVRRAGRPEAQIEGVLSPGDRQRLRNILALYSVQQIARGARPPRR